jgi:hypothetical protein
MANVKLSQTVLQFPKANPAALTSVNDTLVADGVLAYVISLRAMFKLNKSSTETVNGFSVIATNSGTGRWVAAGVRVYTVASQSAMLALTVKPGDISIRTDLNNTIFVRKESTAGDITDWESVLSDTSGFNGIYVVDGDTTVTPAQNNYLFQGDFTSAHDVDLSAYGDYPANFSFQYHTGSLYTLKFISTSPDLLDGLPYFVAPINSSGRIYKDDDGNWHVTENTRPFANVTLINVSTYTVTASDHGSTLIIDNEIDVDITLPQQSDETLPIGFYFTIIPGIVKLGTLIVNGSDGIAGNKHFNGRQPVTVMLSGTIFGANIWTVGSKPTTSAFEIPDVAADYQITNPPYSYYTYNGTLRTGYILPSCIDVASIPNGTSFVISNTSTLTLPIKFYGGTTFFASLAPNNVATITLIDGSTQDGVWDISISSSLSIGTIASQNANNVSFTGGTANNLTLNSVGISSGTIVGTDLNTTVNTLVSEQSLYLQKGQNLNDLTNKPTARTNLGLGSMATQAASSVAITGGTADNTVVGGNTPTTGFFSTLTSLIINNALLGTTNITGINAGVALLTGAGHIVHNTNSSVAHGAGKVDLSALTGVTAFNGDTLSTFTPTVNNCVYYNFGSAGVGLAINTPTPLADLDQRGKFILGMGGATLATLPNNTKTESITAPYIIRAYRDNSGVQRQYTELMNRWKIPVNLLVAGTTTLALATNIQSRIRFTNAHLRLTALTGSVTTGVTISVGTVGAAYNNIAATLAIANTFTTLQDTRDLSVGLAANPWIDCTSNDILVNVSIAATGPSVYTGSLYLSAWIDA